MLKHQTSVDLNVAVVDNALQRTLGDAVLQHNHTMRASSGGEPQHFYVACSWVLHALLMHGRAEGSSVDYSRAGTPGRITDS